MMFDSFSPADLDSVLAIYDSNEQDYFIGSDRSSLEAFLEAENGPFYVLSDRGNCVACGGFWHPETRIASLTWGMVHRDFQRRGYGRAMLLFRLREIEKAGCNVVVCNTSQLTSKFFERFGFRVENTIEDGFGPGIHEVKMKLTLEPSSAVHLCLPQ
jgi:ribosomal protein S18 acetylase RimI-like enzyme